MIGIALKLLGIGKFLREAAGSVFSAAMRYPWQAAFFASLCLSWWVWSGKEKALAQRDASRAELSATVEQFKAAQAAADLAQRQAEAANETLQDERNRITAHVVKAAETARRADVSRYADRMRIKADCRVAAIGSGVHQDPGKPDDQTGAPELVAITRADLDALTFDAVQGAVRYEWLKSLVDSGQAVVVPEVEFGGE